MHMDSVYVHSRVFNDTFQQGHLMDGNPKFAVYMPHRNVCVSASHHVWIYAYANGRVWMFGSKLLQNGKVVDIDLHTKCCRFFYFFKRDSVGRINNILWFCACFKAEHYFLNGNCVQSTS